MMKKHESESSSEPVETGAPSRGDDRDQVFVISVAAELSGLHAQTLRTYDRMGLVSPQRTRGGGRRYTLHDIEMLRTVQHLSQDEGVNLAGIKAILELTRANAELESRVSVMEQRITELLGELDHVRSQSERPRGEIVHVPRSTAVVMWEPHRGSRRRRK